MMRNPLDLTLDHFIPSQMPAPASDATSTQASEVWTHRLPWLRSAFDAVVAYVIRQQTAAARREIDRGKDRLSITPDGD